ncbi:O-antigen polymerase [uncultured Polaribacter sp.]|uniref:O-antigen polymerase n=1 Tax=uncultured Polaribacter sp. TaxID=174711 RepID=UPI00262C8F16|nr:O-antigen polymerase [uncultured Polaribacter sp.]
MFFLLNYDYKNNLKNVFSPGAIFLYFAFLPAFSNLYFSLNPDSFNKIVLSQVLPKFRDLTIVNIALLFVFLGNLVTYVGVNHGVNSDNKIFNIFLNRILLTKYYPKKQNSIFYQNFFFKFGVIVYVLGFLVYLLFVQRMGGLSQIWSELHLRSTNNAGLGYYQSFYMMAIQLGGMIIMWYFKIKKSKLLLPFFILTIIIVGSLGARGPVVIFLLSILIMNHFLFKRVKALFNFKIILLVLFLPFFIVGILQFRSNSLEYYLDHTDEFVDNTIDSFESGFVARVGRLERDVVILSYFDENNFWFGKSYFGLITAPIPRTMFPDKSPVDTGMYLRAMALGDVLEPPLPVHRLRGSSWPEHNWVGYMNFGIFGFIIFYYISGLLFGKFYNFVSKKKFNVLATSLFSILAVSGPPMLSSLGLVSLLTKFLIVYLLIFFILIPLKSRK